MAWVAQRVRAKLKVLDTAENDRWTLPISNFSVKYAINEIPIAIITVPAGEYTNVTATKGEFGDINTGDDVLPRPHQLYEVKIRIAIDTTGYERDIFWGHVVHVNYDKELASQGGKEVVQLACSGVLGLLAGQFNRVEDGRSSRVWTGGGWNLDALGFPYGSIVDDLASGDTTISQLVNYYFRDLCSDQANASDASSISKTAASQAYWAMHPDYGDHFKSHEEEFDKIWSGWSARTREKIAQEMLVTLSESGRNAWSTMVAFCKIFGFAIMPGPEHSYLRPYTRLWDLSDGQLPKLDAERITSIALEAKSNTPSPVRIVRMTGGGGFEGFWNVVDDDYVDDGGILAQVSAGNTARGRTMEIPWPQWFPVDAGWSTQIIARQICRQTWMDEVFRGMDMIIKLPTYDTEGSLSTSGPGTTVKLNNVGTHLSALGAAEDLYAMVKGVELAMVPGKKSGRGGTFEAAYTLSHVMGESVYDSLGLDLHPVVGNHKYIGRSLSNGLIYKEYPTSLPWPPFDS